jgi:alkylation response protein AidB-like acyl-CoA dehydrogenase
MDLAYGPAYDAFRGEVRAFLAEHRAAWPRGAAATRAELLAWQKLLIEHGYAARTIPRRYGGFGAEPDILKSRIIAEEFTRARAPTGLAGQGISMLAPTLLEVGSEDQKARWIAPTLLGEVVWCQGYSEPGSGSDLASLQMSAAADGDDFVCNGHKLWTTHANVANWIFCLVRTAKEAIPQRGITFLLIDMATPGIEVQPIISLSGEHIQNHVFFTDVRVPRANAVGPVGEGWTVAKYLMQFERGGGVSAPGLKMRAARIRRMLSSAVEGLEAAERRSLASQLAQAEIDIAAIEAVELRAMSKLSVGQAPGPESSLLKTVGTELSQRLTELAVTAAGLYAAPYQPHATRPGGPTPGFRPPNDGEAVGPESAYTVTAKYLNDRAGSIYAGTNEIQRNIIAKAVLGL